MSALSLSTILSTAQTAYIAGLLASISPCVVVLIPMILMRFIVISDTIKPQYSPVNGNDTDIEANKNGGVEWQCDGDSCRIVVRTQSSPVNAITVQNNPNIIKPVRSPLNKNNNTDGTPSLILFFLGFQISYLLFGYFISYLLTSSIQNALRMSAGSVSMTFALLSYTSRIEPAKLQLMNNGFVLGITFALLSSFNPCTIPFLAALLSHSTSTAIISIMAFAQGIITPSIIFVLIGRRALFLLVRITAITKYLKSITNVLLFGVGIYFIQSIEFLHNEYELYVATALLACNIYWTLNTILQHSLQRSKDDTDKNTTKLAKYKSVSTVRLSLFTILITVLYLCTSLLVQHNATSHSQLDELLLSVIPTRDIPIQAINTQSHRHLLDMVSDDKLINEKNVKLDVVDLVKPDSEADTHILQQGAPTNDKPKSIIEPPQIEQAQHVILDKQDVKAINQLKANEQQNDAPIINVQALEEDVDSGEDVMSDCLDLSSIDSCDSCNLAINSYLVFSLVLSSVILLCRDKTSTGTHILLSVFGNTV